MNAKQKTTESFMMIIKLEIKVYEMISNRFSKELFLKD
jgi:hypothetical protein